MFVSYFAISSLENVTLSFLFGAQVKDIYGGDCTSLGLPGDLIASSFGKVAQSYPDSIEGSIYI